MKDYGFQDRPGHHEVLTDLPYRRKRQPSIYRQIANDIVWAWHEDRRQFIKICVYAIIIIAALIVGLFL